MDLRDLSFNRAELAGYDQLPNSTMWEAATLRPARCLNRSVQAVAAQIVALKSAGTFRANPLLKAGSSKRLVIAVLGLCARVFSLGRFFAQLSPAAKTPFPAAGQ
jgi:hypothetical protein